MTIIQVSSVFLWDTFLGLPLLERLLSQKILMEVEVRQHEHESRGDIQDDPCDEYLEEDQDRFRVKVSNVQVPINNK